MLKSVRSALNTVGGVHVLAAVLAIGWGLETLARVAQQRQALIDEQQEALELLQGAVADAREQLLTMPLPPEPPPAYPAAEDLNPLTEETPS